MTHLCSVCFHPYEDHRDDHWPPRCCEGCDCGSGRSRAITTQDEQAQGLVTPEQARDSLTRFVASHFVKRGVARFSIPVDFKRDDDMILSRFIRQSEGILHDRERYKGALEKIVKDYESGATAWRLARDAQAALDEPRPESPANIAGDGEIP